jgi:hypothetical protein
MFVAFDTLPAEARVWVYQSNRLLTETEQTEITKFLSDFLENWTAHEQTLKASAKIICDFFLVIALDESFNVASGCSIDKQVHCIKQIEQKWNVSLLDNSQVAYLSDTNEIKFVNFREIKQAISKGKITPQTRIFNKNIATIQDLRNSFLLPAHQMWLKNYFQTAVV